MEEEKLNKMTISDLHQICKENNYRGYSKMGKQKLIELILQKSNDTEKLSDKKIGELRRLGSQYKIKNYYNMKKSLLINLLEEKLRKPQQLENIEKHHTHHINQHVGDYDYLYDEDDEKEEESENENEEEYPIGFDCCPMCEKYAVLNGRCNICDPIKLNSHGKIITNSKYKRNPYRLNKFNKILLQLNLNEKGKILNHIEHFLNSGIIEYMPYLYIIKKICDSLEIENNIEIKETKRKKEIWNEYITKLQDSKT